MSVDPAHLTGPLASRVPAGALRSLHQILREVRRDPAPVRRARGRERSWKVSLGWGTPASPQTTKFVLGEIVGCDDYGHDEKLAWEFSLKFEGVAMTLTFEKFGLQAYVDEQTAEGELEDLAARLLATISRAMPLLQKTVLAEIADEQVTAGKVNIENRYADLLAQYTHFRELAAASLQAVGPAHTIPASDGEPLEVLDFGPHSHALRRQARYESKAAVHAFFSMLEHLLLIGFMLSGEDATGGRLADFIGSGWKDKFKRVVDLSDPKSKHTYDRLVAIHDEVRNPAAHGEVDADGTDFEFLLPGVGPYPARLVVKGGRQRTYKWRWMDVDDLLASLSDVDGWLATEQLCGAVTYGESGLPMFFVDELRTDLAAVRDDPVQLAELIDHIGEMADRHANMDW